MSGASLALARGFPGGDDPCWLGSGQLGEATNAEITCTRPVHEAVAAGGLAVRHALGEGHGQTASSNRSAHMVCIVDALGQVVAAA
jgi:hypothetical protein